MKVYMNRKTSLVGILAITAALAMQAHAQNWFTNGLVAYYPFNGNANDESGLGDNGVVYGAQLCADRFGNTNQAYSFESRNLCAIRTLGRNLPTGSAARTFSLWFRPKPQYPFGTFNTSPFFEFGNASVPENWLRSSLIYQGAPNLVTFYLQTGTNVWSTWKPEWDFAQWHQVVWVVPATNSQTRLYVDGVSQAFNGAPATGAMLNTVSNVFWLGYGSGSYFDGALDDIRIYNRVLPASEVAQLFNLESPTNSEPPTITTQPQDQIVARGRDSFFTVATIGQQPQSYQWRFNGLGLAGATNGVLRVLNATTANDGLYSVVISNTLGVVASTPAHLTVMEPFIGGPPPTNGLVAYYPFSGNANDESGFGDNGVVSNATLTTDRFGTPNSAYSFNSSLSAQITTAGIAVPSGPGKAKTFACWFKMATVSGGGGLLSAGLPGQGNGLAGIISYVNQDTSAMQVGMWESSFIKYFPNSDLYGAWHQYVIVIDSASNVAAYLDGELFSFQTSAPPGTLINIVSAPFIVGHWDGTSLWFDGQLDDVRIYDRALSTQEVYQLYNAEVPPPPAITSQPQGVIIVASGSTTFSVAANGAPPLSYQWRKDGVGLPNGTNAMLTLTNVQPSCIGDYTVVVSNPYGSVTSSVATLSISNVNSALWQGLVAYYPFNANANDESGFGDHGVVQGATLAPDRAGVLNSAYDFVATNHDTITASGINLPRSNAPRTLSFWLKARPLNSRIFSVEYPAAWGNTAYHGATFGAVLTSDNGLGVVGNFADTRSFAFRPLDDIWHQAVFTFAGGTNISGCLDGFNLQIGDTGAATLLNTASGPLTIGSFLNTGWFEGQIDDVRIYNRALSSAEAQELYVEEAGSGPRITNIVSASADVGQPATVSIMAVGGQPISYQWYDRYDLVVPGATNTSLSIAYAAATNLGTYRVVASNAWGMASAPVTLTVANPYSPVYLPLPKVLPGTERVTLLPNGDLELVAGTNAAGDLLATNWNVSGRLTLGSGTNTTLTNGSYVSMAYITSNLTSSSRYQRILLEPDTEYVLSGYVWNMGDATNKVNTALDATDVIWDPQINFGPQYQHADQGYFVYRKFHSAASGTNVQIRAFYDGFTGTGASAGYYPLAAQWDNIAVTKASEFVPPTITVPILLSQPDDRTVVATSSLQMPVQVQSTLPVSFQWLKDGRALSAATDRVLTLANVGAQDAGTYTVVVTNAYGAITSSPVRLTVQALTVPDVLAGPITNLANGHLYYVLEVSSWMEAQQAAVQLGGNLATIRNADEQEWIWRTCSGFDTSHYFWIGLFDPEPFVNSTNTLERRNEFRWVSGEPVSYSNWLGVEPNNYGDLGEFYGTLYPIGDAYAGYWNDMYEASTTHGPGIAEVIPPRTATGTATLFGVFVVAVNITDGGSGYTNTPIVRFVGGGGRGAQAFAVVSNGVITAITMLDAGYGYTNAPLVVIDPPFIPNPVLGIAPMSFLAFSNLTVGGAYQLQQSVGWYWTNEPVSFTAAEVTYMEMVAGLASSGDYRLALNPVPAQAFATAEVVYGFVVGAAVTSGGSGYVTSPAVTIVGGGGTNATAVSYISGGVVRSIGITSAGIGYTNTPTVEIAQPPAAAVSPTVLPVMRVDAASLAPYNNYQIQFKQALGGAWQNWADGLFSPADVTSSQYLFITNSAGFFRLQYVP